MGQAQSEIASVPVSNHLLPPPPPQPESSAFQLDSHQDNESIHVIAQKILECPCLADLTSGPCGTQFSDAFLCFLNSTAEEKGSDCVPPFIALQYCIKANPGAFSKDSLGEDGKNEASDSSQDHKIIPPSWSKEKKSKL